MEGSLDKFSHHRNWSSYRMYLSSHRLNDHYLIMLLHLLGVPLLSPLVYVSTSQPCDGYMSMYFLYLSPHRNLQHYVRLSEIWPESWVVRKSRKADHVQMTQSHILTPLFGCSCNRSVARATGVTSWLLDWARRRWTTGRHATTPDVLNTPDPHSENTVTNTSATDEDLQMLQEDIQEDYNERRITAEYKHAHVMRLNV